MSDRARRHGLTALDGETPYPVYRDDSEGTYHLWFDDGEYDAVSTAVVVGVAAVRGVEPTTLEPLSNAIEPDALNGLCQHWLGLETVPTAAQLSFSFAGCQVTVHPDGEIELEAAAEG